MADVKQLAYHLESEKPHIVCDLAPRLRRSPPISLRPAAMTPKLEVTHAATRRQGLRQIGYDSFVFEEVKHKRRDSPTQRRADRRLARAATGRVRLGTAPQPHLRATDARIQPDASLPPLSVMPRSPFSRRRLTAPYTPMGFKVLTRLKFLPALGILRRRCTGIEETKRTTRAFQNHLMIRDLVTKPLIR